MAHIVTGSVGTAADLGINQARRKIIMRDKLAELEPSVNPLTLLLRKAGKKAVGGPKYEWLEHQRFDDLTTLTANSAAADTTLDVADGTIGAAGQLAQNQRTGETVSITSVAADVWTVVRSVGAVAAADMLDGDDLIMLSTSFAENSDAPDPRKRQETNEHNFTQIARSTFGASGTLIHTDIYGTRNIMSEQAAQRAMDHQAEIEKTLFFGERSEVTTGDYAKRTCGGVDEIITDVYDFGGSFSMLAGFDALETGMRYGANTKTLFAGRAPISNISAEALDKVRTTVSEKTFGINVTRLESPHGVVMLIRHDLLVGSVYGLRGYLLDLDALMFVFLRGRDTALYEGLETNGQDGEIHGYLTEFGLERMEAQKHQLWTGMAT